MTEEAYVPVSDMNGLGFKPFDLVIPFAVRKGEITGKPLQESPSPLSAIPAAQNSAGEVALPSVLAPSPVPLRLDNPFL